MDFTTDPKICNDQKQSTHLGAYFKAWVIMTYTVELLWSGCIRKSREVANYIKLQPQSCCTSLPTPVPILWMFQKSFPQNQYSSYSLLFSLLDSSPTNLGRTQRTRAKGQYPHLLNWQRQGGNWKLILPPPLTVLQALLKWVTPTYVHLWAQWFTCDWACIGCIR